MKGVPKGEFVRRRHDLPHWQIGGRTYFITFRVQTGTLCVAERRKVLEVIHVGREKHFDLHAAVVMPDHVHLLLTPKEIEGGHYFDISQINKGIRGVSAREINKLRGVNGQLWQGEPFDRMIRDENEFSNTWNYIFNNPTWAHLADDPEHYPFFWSQVFDPNTNHG